MQNELLPEETPQYQTPALITRQTESAAETETTAENVANSAELQSEIRAAERITGRRMLVWMLGLNAACMGPFAFLMAPFINPPTLNLPNAIAGAAVSLLGGVGVMSLASNRGRPLRNYAGLVERHGAGAIDLLLQWRQNNLSRANLRAIDAALIEALSRTDADSTCFSERHSFYLRLVLSQNVTRDGKSAYNPALCLAILAALNRVGDPAYLPLAEKLAALNARNPDAERIRAAARKCLPRLREQEQIVAAEKSLLPETEAAETGVTFENAEISGALQAQLRRVSRRHKIRPLIGGAALFGVFGIVSAYQKLLDTLDTPRAIYQSMWAFLAVLLTLTLGGMFLLVRGSRLKAKNLKRYGGLKTVGPLIDMLGTAYTQEDKEAIQIVLTPLLTQLRPTDSNRLNRRQRAILNRSLQSVAYNTRLYVYSETFDLAVLKALEQVGEASAVPVVENLSLMEADTTAKIRIRRAAADCLPLLQIRAGLVAESKTLLRASASEAAGRDTLLRAASGTSDKAPEQLLRPSDSGQ